MLATDIDLERELSRYSLRELEEHRRNRIISRQTRAERIRALEDVAASRERCQEFSQFVREAWHVLEPDVPYVHGWHIDAKCEHLEAVSYGQITRLQINEPPGCMKSMITSVLWQAWEWGPLGRPALRYLTTSYEQSYAVRDARKTRDLIMSEWYQVRWPLELTRVAEMSFENARRGTREAKPFASLTAGRGNRVIIDDPHSVDTVESEPDRAKVTRRFRDSVTSRLNNRERDAIIVIMHRLHPDDVCGVIERLHLPYTKLVLPMEFEPKRRCVTPIGWKDPRKYEGELLFPEFLPAETVAAEKVALTSIGYAGQYQQRPVPREGAMFKRAWFTEDCYISHNEIPRGTVFVRHWDLAATKKKTSARTAGVKLGKTPDDRYIVAHCIATQEEGAEVRRLIKATAEQDGHDVHISLPQDPGQAGKVQAQDYVKMLAGFIVKAVPESGSKETRADPFSAQCEHGNVLLVRGDWNEAYIDEICEFPGGSFADRVDASSGAFGYLTTEKISNYTANMMAAVRGGRR